MKAAVIRAFGDPQVLQIEEVETPRVEPGHVLIKVLAAGVNRLDHNIREGGVAPELPFPHILGADAVGEVVALGSGVNQVRIGDRVIPLPGFPEDESEYDSSPAALAPSFALLGLGRSGTYAQYLHVPAPFVIRDQTGLDPEEVATLPVALGTSVRAVKVVGGVTAGDKVLVQAGASGSGSMQIQVAKALGALVATTVRGAAKADLAGKLGADLVIDVRNEDLHTRVQAWTDGRGADVVIDNLGGEVLKQSIAAVKPQGVVVVYGFAAGTEVGFDVRDLFFAQKQLKGSMASDKADLELGLEWVREGKIRPVLDRALPLGEADEAHRLIARNQVAGNLVLLPWAD
jgi:NADPH:quinone reductase-like Zn-dependent oxidoreductase